MHNSMATVNSTLLSYHSVYRLNQILYKAKEKDGSPSKLLNHTSYFWVMSADLLISHDPHI